MKKILITIILFLLIILLYFNVVSAYNLELILSADKTDVKVGDKVTVTLSLSQGMQAADFTINYDSNLLKFETASLGQNFYSTKEPGKIICSWFDTKDTTKFTFTFSAISSGTAKFTTTTENFYDGSLQSASSYNEGNLNITLLSSTNTNMGTNQSQTNNNIQNKTQNSTNEEIQQIEAKKEDTKTNITTNNQITNKNNSSTYTTQPSSSNTVSTYSNTTLPQTGNNSTFIIFIVFGVVMLAIISKIKLNKLRDI